LTTTREETALHLIVQNSRFKVLVWLVELLKRHKKEQLINWKDHSGDTSLHLAATCKNFEARLAVPLFYRTFLVHYFNEGNILGPYHMQKSSNQKELI